MWSIESLGVFPLFVIYLAIYSKYPLVVFGSESNHIEFNGDTSTKNYVVPVVLSIFGLNCYILVVVSNREFLVVVFSCEWSGNVVLTKSWTLHAFQQPINILIP